MISAINSDDNNLLQLLLQAGKKTSSSSTDNSSTSISSVNSNGDDFLTCLKSNFKAADSNYDNELSAKEIDSFSKVAGMKPQMGPPAGMFIENAEQKSSDDDAVSSLIGSLDKDSDGTLSLDELTAKTNQAASGSSNNSDTLTDKISSFANSTAGSDIAQKMGNFIGKKIQEVYSGGSLNASSVLGSAISHAV